MRASFEGIVWAPDGRAFAIPRIELEECESYHLVERVNEAVSALCGAPVTTLRCLVNERPDDEHRHRHYELEAHGPVSGLSEVEVETPPPGNAWERRGWFGEATAWIHERVDAPVEQRSTWSISTLLRAGDTYFKAVPPLFATEPAITRFLSAAHPGRLPDVVDVDTERGWLLTRDFGGALLRRDQPLEAWRESLVAYADLQRAWVGRTDELHAAGCPDRTLPQLERDLDVVLADRDAMLVGRPEGLSEEQLAALPRLRERLRDVVARVAAHDVPPTLDHGDFHAGNIALREDGPLLFDWSDACVALPLVSVTPLLLWDEPPDGALPLLRDAYLERIDAPAVVYEDALVLGLAHQAVSYHRIAEAVAPHARWQWERVLPWIVQQLFERVAV